GANPSQFSTACRNSSANFGNFATRLLDCTGKNLQISKLGRLGELPAPGMRAAIGEAAGHSGCWSGGSPEATIDSTRARSSARCSIVYCDASTSGPNLTTTSPG